MIKYDLLPRWRNGIRSGLKNLWSQGREGSIPSLGTNKISLIKGGIFLVSVRKKLDEFHRKSYRYRLLCGVLVGCRQCDLCFQGVKYVHYDRCK